MNKNGLIMVLMLFATWLQAAEEKKTIYKYTDENGVTHYSETKPNDNYKEADLPQLSIIPSAQVDQTNTQSSAPDEDSIDPSVITEFEIIEPSHEQNLWGTGSTITARVTDLNAAQLELYTIQFSIDGEKQKPAEKTTQTFTEIYRGAHTVQAFLLNKYTLKQFKKTKPVTFFMHQRSVQH